MKLINESPLLARFGKGFLEVVETRLSGELQELGLTSLEQIVVTKFEAEAYARTVHRYGDRLDGWDFQRDSARLRSAYRGVFAALGTDGLI